jgi:tetratricopeptide (TPR) repeat protein/O-antigen ligase
MQTKLSRYCEGMMEAAWLLAVLVIPVFFNIFSARIFEPDKLTLLRTLALLILAGWSLKLIDQAGFHWENLQPEGSPFRSLLKIPLLIPVIALAVIYLVSTLFSVSPSTSFWGSYQRLQGTYTTFSYLVIFAALAANLRRREQVERLFTVMILSSLPVSLYGVLQRFQLDPIPWGGNVTNRIAANMGNSIFVAAFLIMAFPPTLIRIINSFDAILKDRARLWPNFARATAYVLIAVLQLIAIYFSGSRGPWIGLGVGTILMALILSLIWRKRWLTLAGIGLAAVAVVFLLVLNIPDGPLQSLREVPGVGRLGQIFDTESRTGRVRSLIWQGASDLFLPHSPLQFPDGRQDNFNFLRPLIGYGPESMYVAFNRFYPPELTQVEMRNASPDRSHNETWDALVMNGVLGLAVYLLLFGQLFYYGLKWLGLVSGPRQRNLFIALYVIGGIISSIAAVLWKGIGYFGVGLPLGIIAGVMIYLILQALSGTYAAPQTRGELARALTLTALLGMLAAHFVEINFGIAIASTRTYFWTASALLLLVGYILPRCGEYEMMTAAGEAASTAEASESGPVALRAGGGAAGKETGKSGSRPADRAALRKKGRPVKTSGRSALGPTPWLRQALVGGLLLAALFGTLGYNYISGALGGDSALGMVWNSFTRLRGSDTISLGLLSLALITWLAGAVLFASEAVQFDERLNWGKLLGGILGISLAIGLFFWIWHAAGLRSAGNLTSQSIEAVLQLVRRYEGNLTRYYAFLIPALLALAFFLPPEIAGKARESRSFSKVAAPVFILAALAITAYTNLRTVQADIAFKLAEPFARGTTWPVAVGIYQRAIQLAPSEDYYYLFLGRSYFEQAKITEDPEQQEQIIAMAERDLKKAQEINPLNTDHTANLARLNSLWAIFSQDPEARKEKSDLSSSYFQQAVTLSPNNAKLWDEWALLYLNTYNQPQRAFELISQAEDIDPFYDYTHMLLAEYYARLADSLVDPEEKAQAVERAIFHYQEAFRLGTDAASKTNSVLALAQLYFNQSRPAEAIASVEEAIRLFPNSPDIWRYEQMLAQLYTQTGDKGKALEHAGRSLASAPEAQRANVQNLIAQIQSLP